MSSEETDNQPAFSSPVMGMGLTAERWQRTKEIFGAALAMTPGERPSFLRQVCGLDDTLRAEVESLLAEAKRTSSGTGLVLGSAPSTAEESAVAFDDHMIGRHIGPYVIVRKIGQGGMAVVFLASRADDQYRKQVAIKLVSPWMDHSEILRRFRAERQTLADLDHPNIVKLLDGGTSEEGLPYLVMDYVEGLAVGEYCERHNLSITARIRLFRSVCAAVQYAHQNSVIHRDLKPSNILVTEAGTAKLLDFGIAKVLNATPSRQTPLTQLSVRQLTPAYASPEQIRGDPVSYATDIYSLGVVLYELLTGHRPYQLQRYTPAEMERVICEMEPEKPSTVVKRVETAVDVNGGTCTKLTPEQVSRSREGKPQKLHRRLRGDLDRIVLMALHKEPARRYATVEDFSTDLERHIEHRPVNARPPTLSYWATKFIKRHRTEITAAALTMLFLVAGSLAVWWQGRRAQERAQVESWARQARTVVIADFANSTGEPVFDDTLKQALAVELEQSPLLTLVSDERIRETLKLMDRPPNTKVDAAAAREVCQRIQGNVVLGGSISKLGTRYLIGLEAVDCSSDDSIATEQADTANKEGVLKAVDLVAARVRNRLGESRQSTQKFSTPIETATTSSLQALQAFSLGWKIQGQTGNAAAIPFFQRAIKLDRNFAMAYAGLGICYSNLSEPTRASEQFRHAYQLSDNISEREKLLLQAEYYSFVTGELEKADSILLLWQETYPHDFVPYGDLGNDAITLGRYRLALEKTRECLRLNPGSGTAYGNLIEIYAALRQFDDAKAVYLQSVERRLDIPMAHFNRYGVAFVQQDADEMRRQMDWAASEQEGGWLLFAQSQTEAFAGRLQNFRVLCRRACDVAQRNDLKEMAALWKITMALVEAEFGLRGNARANLIATLPASSGRDVQVLAALAFARAGDSIRARKIANQLSQKFPVNTTLNNYWLPTIRAAIELDNKHPTKAIELLQKTQAYELGDPPPFQQGTLYPVYIRGQCYLLLDKGQEAADQFKTMLENAGIVRNFPLLALAHLGIARAYARSNNKEKSRAAYRDFLKLWKAADADVPVLLQAQAEYAKMR
jgi:serine/threonine protein kinase/tetratricopeptide (TPR) repeat protein